MSESMDETKLTARERLALRRAEEETRRAAEKALKAEAMAELELTALDKLPGFAAKFGDVDIVSTVLGPVIVRGPTDKHYAAYLNKVTSGLRAEGLEALACACAVDPAPAEFAEMIKRKPAIMTDIANKGAELAGVQLGDAPKG